MTDKTERDALVARLRMHARDCVSAADIDTDTVLSAAQIDDMADALNEAAEALAATAASVDASKIMEVVERYAGKTANATKYIRQDLLKLIDSAGGANEITGSVSPQMRDANACTPQPDGGDGAWPIDWSADGHNVRIRADDARVLILINGSESQCSMDDANALLALLESLENGGME